MCSSSPDTSGMNAAAVQQASLSKEQLDWAKQIYAETAPDRAAATARAGAVSDAQLESMRTQTELAKDYSDYQKNTFRPLEQGIVADAAAYDTPERRAAAATAANADVTMALANQRSSTNRELERSGVTPGSGKQLALSGAMDLGAAKLKAGAANTARTQVETIGAAKKMDAANLGRGLASSQATSAGLALTAGNNSVGNAQVPLNVAGQGAALVNSGYAGAQSGLSNAASTYGQIASAQNSGGNSGLFGALGNVAGAYAGSQAGSTAISSLGSLFMSDKNIKEDRKPVSSEMSLAAVRKLPVESWKYKDDSAAADGGKTHVGPMAQEVRKGLGDQVAPGGKAIDLISLTGHTLGAIKAIDKRLMRLEHARPKAKASN